MYVRVESTPRTSQISWHRRNCQQSRPPMTGLLQWQTTATSSVASAKGCFGKVVWLYAKVLLSQKSMVNWQHRWQCIWTKNYWKTTFSLYKYPKQSHNKPVPVSRYFLYCSYDTCKHHCRSDWQTLEALTHIQTDSECESNPSKEPAHSHALANIVSQFTLHLGLVKLLQYFSLFCIP